MKRLIALFAAMIMLTGCSLANEEARTGDELSPAVDMLVGLLVTTDEETPLIDGQPLHYFANEGKKFYAEYVEETVYDDDGGAHISHRYAFPEGTGMYFLGYRALSGTEDEYWTSDLTPGLESVRNAFYGDHVELEAAVYVTEDSALRLHAHPVYQEPDGDIYALAAPGSVHAADGLGISFGGVAEEDGETVQQSSVKLTIRVVRPPQRYVLVSMDENNQLLGTETFEPEQLPREYAPDAGTAYLILECYSTDGKVERFVYSPGDREDTLETFCAWENGICARGYTQIKWEVAE